MKFNIEVEIDWIDDEGTLDSEIKDAVINKVTAATLKRVEEQIDEKVDKMILEKAESKAQKICNGIADGFMQRKFTKTDRYGDKIESLTVRDMFKREFDKFWNTLTDSSGRPGNYSGSKKTRIQWLIDSSIEKHSKEFAEILTKDTQNKIKKSMSDNLKASIGDKLVRELGFDKLLLQSK